jgi:hypothetical protein
MKVIDINLTSKRFVEKYPKIIFTYKGKTLSNNIKNNDISIISFLKDYY